MTQIIKYGESEGIDQKMVEVTPFLWQGSRGPCQNDTILVELGITQVLSVTPVSLTPIRQACRWTVAVDDGKGWQLEHIKFILAFAHFIDKSSVKAAVHCDHGASRSAGGVILWKMQHDKIDKFLAYDWLKSVNPFANCNPAIFESLPLVL